jgi:CubicO group peptidase (beta-lactamase class C family)
MTDNLFSAVREHIQSEMTHASIPGFAVGVAREGEVLWEEAFGWADRDRRIPADAHTMFSLASISKPITATGLMKLVEQGKIDLDQPVNEYLSKDGQLKIWIGDPDDVSVRRVANHTSGLPLHYHFFSEEGPSKPPMEESIRRYGNVVCLPGERYRYSNIGYGILDHLIERVSGISYAEFMRREVFLPLGMTRASVNIGPGLEAFRAQRYTDAGLALPFYDFDHPGASAVFCSVHDLLRFGMFHLKQRLPDQNAILSDESIDAMQVPTADQGKGNPNGSTPRPTSKYGVGWVIDDDELGLRISHRGGMGGVSTKLLMLPREGIVIVTLANFFHPLAYTIYADILSALIPGFGNKFAEIKASLESPGTDESDDTFEPVPELLGDWAGTVHTWQGEHPLQISFKPSGDIHARLGDQMWTLINDAQFEEARLTGKMLGDIGTEDTARCHHHLHLDLMLREGVLNGTLHAMSHGCELGYALGHWCEVRR